jgi:hypothetical protein
LLQQAHSADLVQEQGERIAAGYEMEKSLPIKPKDLQVAKAFYRGRPLHLLYEAYLSKELPLSKDGKGFVIPTLAFL